MWNLAREHPECIKFFFMVPISSLRIEKIHPFSSGATQLLETLDLQVQDAENVIQAAAFSQIELTDWPEEAISVACPGKRSSFMGIRRYIRTKCDYSY